jgi:hypothetical protein
VLYVILEAVFIWLCAGREDGRISWARVAFVVFLLAAGVATVIKQAG